MVKQSKIKNIIICIGITLSFLATVLSWNSTEAVWQDPGTSAPNGNIANPLNISGGSQGRLGDLGIGTLYPANKLDIRTDSTASQLHISSTGLADGAYLTAYQDSGIMISGGAEFDGSGWKARAANASIIKAAAGSIYFYTNTGLTSGNTFTETERLKIQSDGNIVASNNIYAPAYFYNSDALLKKDIEPIGNSAEKISRLNGVYFKWKDSGTPAIGLIAQNVETVFPEAVSVNPDTGMKSVNYAALVAPLIETVKEQQTKISDLEKKIDMLQSRIDNPR